MEKIILRYKRNLLDLGRVIVRDERRELTFDEVASSIFPHQINH